jgi:hypothetical protein
MSRVSSLETTGSVDRLERVSAARTGWRREGLKDSADSGCSGAAWSDLQKWLHQTRGRSPHSGEPHFRKLEPNRGLAQAVGPSAKCRVEPTWRRTEEARGQPWDGIRNIIEPGRPPVPNREVFDQPRIGGRLNFLPSARRPSRLRPRATNPPSPGGIDAGMARIAG